MPPAVGLTERKTEQATTIILTTTAIIRMKKGLIQIIVAVNIIIAEI